MTVAAKFYVQKVEPREGYATTAAQIQLGAVCRGIENASWSSATPWGTITMGVLNDQATAYFEEGAEYEVTFRRVEKPAPGDGHQVQPVTDKYGNTLCGFCGTQMAVKAGLPGWTDEKLAEFAGRAQETHRKIYEEPNE